ncbi:MAG: tRNA-dihydrouridine synthase, partial [Planctomycetota bacterium]|nr:tRNA-dihydrouridine synthase [Planctomycetota bacterium]
SFADQVILGSGDLFTPESCLEMIAETGVDGVTVARGAIGNPWIFEQTLALSAGKKKPDPPTLFRQRIVIEEHYQLAEQLYGERSGPMMRKFGIKYSALHPRHLEVRQAFTRVKNFEQWKQVLDHWYGEDLAGVYPDGRLHKAQGSCETG